MTRILVIIALFGCLAGPAPAQQRSPQSVMVEVGGGGSSDAAFPFWLYSNRMGMIDDAPRLGYVRALATASLWSSRSTRVDVGADVVARWSASSTAYFNQLYVRAQWQAFQLRIGREVESIGLTAGVLSSGSMGTSLNATPMPKVVVSLPAYQPVPGTRGYLEFRGHLTHGWFEDGREVQNAWLHEKSLYLRAGGRLPLNVYAGLVHDAVWAGQSERHGDIPDGLDDFVRVFFALRGSADAPAIDQDYIQGNHLGIYDMGLTYRHSRATLLVYRHMPFNDKDGVKLKTWQDGLQGIAVTRADRGFIDQVVYEYLYTKWQSGPKAPTRERDGPAGRDDYYNHGIYRHGWTYYRRTLGSPFLFPHEDLEDSPNRLFIANTRLVGHHLGIGGHPWRSVEYRVMVSYTRNYGTYYEKDAIESAGGVYRFNPPLEQVSLQVQGTVTLPRRPAWSIGLAVGWDKGQVYEDRLGALLTLRYRVDRF